MPRTAGSSQYEIRVEREELLRYLAVLSKSISAKDKVARISFDDGWLMIAVGEADFAKAVWLRRERLGHCFDHALHGQKVRGQADEVHD